MRAEPWALEPDDAARAAGVEAARGLDAAEVAARRAAHGPNELEHEPPTPLWRLVLAQFDDMMVKARQRAAAVLRAGRARARTVTHLEAPAATGR